MVVITIIIITIFTVNINMLRLSPDHACCFVQETRCFDALAELYSHLSEDDILYGLWKRRCIHEATRAGLSLVQHGYLEQAQDVFLDSMKIDTKSPAPNGTVWAWRPVGLCPLGLFSSLCPWGFCPILVWVFLCCEQVLPHLYGFEAMLLVFEA